MVMKTWNFDLSTADGNINVLITHPLQNGLIGRRFHVPGKGHVFFAQAGHGRADLGAVCLGLRIDGNLIERIRISRNRAELIGCALSQRVLVVEVSLSFGTIPISPEWMVFIGITSLPRMSCKLPRRSSIPRVWFQTRESEFMIPE